MMRAIYYNLCCAAFMALVSCITDDPYRPSPQDGPQGFSFTLQTSSPSAGSTRGVTGPVNDLYAAEKDVNRLDIFFYSTDGGSCLFYPDPSQLYHDADNGRVTINIPDQIQTTIGNADLNIFVIANRTPGLTRQALAGKTLEELEEVVATNADGMEFNRPDGNPADFLMTGLSADPVSLDAGDPNLGNITLRRAAAKIVVDITKADVTGYTPISARVRITNYLDKTATVDDEAHRPIEDDYLSDGWKPLSPVPEEETTLHPFEMDLAGALYTYSNDWRNGAGRETYLTLEIEWRKGAEDSRLYYYRIPFSYLNATDPAQAELNRDRIRRNHVYKFALDVTILGGLDPEEPVTLDANFDVIDWTDDTVEVSIQSFDYLFVIDPVAKTTKATHTWDYFSSLPATIEISRAWCFVFSDSRGTLPEGEDFDYREQGTGLWPKLTPDSDPVTGRTWFTVEGWIPENFVPLEIEITLSNAAGLTATVRLTIYPSEYITAHPSTNSPYTAGAYGHPQNATGGNWGSNNPNGDTGQRNFNFYTVTILSPPKHTVRVDRTTVLTVMLGDPSMPADNPYNSNPLGVTFIQTDPNKNHLISPAFVVASQRGITATTQSWSDAWERCRRYRESEYPAGTWRVPTFAELAMLGYMQNHDGSAIKDLFTNRISDNPGWWTAMNAWRINAAQYNGGYDSLNGVNSGNTASVRCVHDIWKDQP